MEIRYIKKEINLENVFEVHVCLSLRLGHRTVDRTTGEDVTRTSWRLVYLPTRGDGCRSGVCLILVSFFQPLY